MPEFSGYQKKTSESDTVYVYGFAFSKIKSKFIIMVTSDGGVSLKN